MGYGGYQLNLWRWRPLQSDETLRHDISFDLIQTSSQVHYQTCRDLRKSPPSLPRLPPEIVFDILQFAACSSTTRPDRTVLSILSLVSPMWKELSHNILFRHVVISSGKSYHSFVSAITASPRLASIVLVMDITVDFGGQPDALSYDQMADVICCCPRLSELGISIYGQRGPGPRVAPTIHTRTLRRLHCGPQIRSLRFNNWSDSPRLLESYLSVYRSVKTISLSGMAPEFCVDNANQRTPTGLSLETLILNVAPSATSSWLEGLLTPAAPLRSLQFSRGPDPCLLEYLLRRHSSTIQSLRIPQCGYAEGEVLKACGPLRLRELSVESSSIRTAVLDDILVPVTVEDLAGTTGPNSEGQSAAQGVEHLALGVGSETPLCRIIHKLRSTYLPGREHERSVLRKLTLLLRPDGHDHPLLGWLTEICREQEIELRCTNDPTLFRSLTINA
ncbi:hypothetical protein PUNSTDRAFT_123879 [Punctularia strigosozonata HHB-11173 SS5]|uniref:uncharacterized protein n=1 Tax=Punctularia strigosozonata (strain HHB-11173) TaxID=741275 RepID=UPI0004417F9C|nr:uncharacterized protein PUNSTDRAFT_123879 [Punctularia strigosozonata HHB-11173 SS5]EIN14261.1 hypothetical protein PUNSTDRAFT_123879 [Punctularia strigosozonata HHB-11173 SS5]